MQEKIWGGFGCYVMVTKQNFKSMGIHTALQSNSSGKIYFRAGKYLIKLLNKFM